MNHDRIQTGYNIDTVQINHDQIQTGYNENTVEISHGEIQTLYTQTVPTPQSAMKSSHDTEEIPEFTEEEVERAIKRMNKPKAQGMDGITSDIIKLGGPIVLTYLTNIFINILRT